MDAIVLSIIKNRMEFLKRKSNKAVNLYLKSAPSFIVTSLYFFILLLKLLIYILNRHEDS